MLALKFFRRILYALFPGATVSGLTMYLAIKIIKSLFDFMNLPTSILVLLYIAIVSNVPSNSPLVINHKNESFNLLVLDILCY